MKNKFITALVFNWRIVSVSVFALVAVFLLYTVGATSLLPGMSAEEALSQTLLKNNSLSTASIFANPVYLPYYFVLYIAQLGNFDSVMTLRLISAVLSVITVAAFYYIMQSWITNRMAIASTILFATSSWMLHIARLGTVDAMYACSIVALAFAIWLQNTRHRRLILFFIATSVIFIYVPGFIWIIGIGLIWQRKRLFNELRRSKLFFQILIGLYITILLTPLIIMTFINASTVFELLGLPSSLPSISVVLENIKGLLFAIAYNGLQDHTRWLPGTPLLSSFSLIMFVLGLYKCWRMRMLDRSRAIVVGLLFWSLLIIIGGPVKIAMLAPYFFAIVGFGLTLMLQQWFAVFPKNNIARAAAISMITFAVGMNILYNFNHYFFAWVRSPETKQVFNNPGATSGTIEFDR